MLITALGLLALAELLGRAHSGVHLPARLAALVFAAATVSLVIAEASGLRNEQLPSALVAFVIPAFLSQAAFGALLARTRFLPAGIGWTAIVFNLGWLIVLPIITPSDIYYPALHHPIPIAIGIVLLRRR